MSAEVEATKSRIVAAAGRYGVPPAIALGVARAESNFEQQSISRCGAIGVMQLMPATAAALGVDPQDEDQNIDGGVRLLAENFKRFGDWSYALAAYNAGPSRAAKGPDEWPAETRAYVPQVIAYAGMVPAEKGAGVDPVPNVAEKSAAVHHKAKAHAHVVARAVAHVVAHPKPKHGRTEKA